MKADRGAITAEFALALPSLVLVMILLFGGIGLALTAISDFQSMATLSVMLGRGETLASAALKEYSVIEKSGLVCLLKPGALISTGEVCAIDYR